VAPPVTVAREANKKREKSFTISIIFDFVVFVFLYRGNENV
jgi:hypothetical protein